MEESLSAPATAAAGGAAAARGVPMLAVAQRFKMTVRACGAGAAAAGRAPQWA